MQKNFKFLWMILSLLALSCNDNPVTYKTIIHEHTDIVLTLTHFDGRSGSWINPDDTIWIARYEGLDKISEITLKTSKNVVVIRLY